MYPALGYSLLTLFLLMRRRTSTGKLACLEFPNVLGFPRQALEGFNTTPWLSITQAKRPEPYSGL